KWFNVHVKPMMIQQQNGHTSSSKYQQQQQRNNNNNKSGNSFYDSSSAFAMRSMKHLRQHRANGIQSSPLIWKRRNHEEEVEEATLDEQRTASHRSSSSDE